MAANLDFSLISEGKKMETVFLGSTEIYRCEKLSSIKTNMNLTQNFEMLQNDIHYAGYGVPELI